MDTLHQYFSGRVYLRLLLSATTVTDTLSTPVVVNNQSTKKQVPVAVSSLSPQKTFDQQLDDFYQQQTQLKSQFPTNFNGQPFDVVVLNIWFLATADLDAIGVRPRDLFDNFDILFSNFNSATSYSGPAAIRLLRASCGQLLKTNCLNL